jgi:hypothetical protein
MDFSPDLRTFYHTDSIPREIYAYDYDLRTHQIGAKRLLVKQRTDLTDRYVSTASAGTGGLPLGLERVGYDYSAHRGGALYRVRGLGIRGKARFETDLRWPT